MEVDPGGVDVGVTEEFLNSLDIGACLVQVCGESVTQRLGGCRLQDRGLAERLEKSALDAPC